MGVALASGAIACALERRNLLLATLASCVLLGVTVGLIVFPRTTWHGLPTLETLRHTLDASGLIGEQARLQVAPTAPLKPLILAGIVAIWAAMFSCHALAFRAGSPLLSLLPPIALMAFADTVLEELIKPIYGVAFLGAALVVVFADALRRVQGWGPIWVGPGSRARLSATASRGARRVAVASVATAALVPLLVPGFGSKAIFDISSTASSDRVRIDPLVSIKASLTREDPVEVFQVTSTVPSYWRMLALPDFDGVTWRPDNSVEGTPITPETALSPDAEGSGSIEQTFQVSSDLDLPWLPVAYPPQRVDVPGISVNFDAETGSVNLDGNLDAGAVYLASSVSVQPTPDQLASIVFPFVPSARYTALPEDLPPGIREIALDWTADASNSYEQILAIQDHLSDTSVFTYSQDVPARDDNFTLLDFLARSRTGFCQQFASAMGVMLRSLGIPARVAVGFTPGTFDPDTQTRHVTTKEAHSWVEVLFPTYGWLSFEPTPGRTNPIALGYQHPATDCSTGAEGCDPGTRPADGAGGIGDADGLSPQLRALLRRPEILSGRRLGSTPRSGADLVPDAEKQIPISIVALTLAVAALLAALLIPPIRSLVRRRRIRRPRHDPRALILATYHLFTERAADLGHPRGPGETLEEYRQRLGTEGALAEGKLDPLTTIAGRAAYAREDPGDEDAHMATDAAASALSGLRKQAGLRQRIIGQYRLRS
jgi:transglutaminase-like putative cysteine protease